MKKLIFLLPLLLLAACNKSPYGDIGGDYTALIHYRYYGTSTSHDERVSETDYEGVITIIRIAPGKIKATWTTADHSEASINLRLEQDTPDSLIFKVIPPGYRTPSGDLNFSKADKSLTFIFSEGYRSSPNYWVSETYTIRARH